MEAFSEELAYWGLGKWTAEHYHTRFQDHQLGTEIGPIILTTLAKKELSRKCPILFFFCLSQLTMIYTTINSLQGMPPCHYIG